MPRDYQTVHAELVEADRERGRVAHRLTGDTEHMTDRQWERAEARAKRSPEYQAADARYRELSDELKRDHAHAEARANRRLARQMGF